MNRVIVKMGLVISEDEESDSEFTGKDGYKWSKIAKCNRRTPRSNIITSKPGPKNDAIDADTPEKAFSLFLSDEILTVITCWTNQKIQIVKEKYATKPGFIYDLTVKDCVSKM